MYAMYHHREAIKLTYCSETKKVDLIHRRSELKKNSSLVKDAPSQRSAH